MTGSLPAAEGSCSGSVWFDELFCSEFTSGCASGFVPGANVASSTRVTFTRCNFNGEGSLGLGLSSAASAGLQAEASTVHIFDCVIVGGNGGGAPLITQPGAAGLRVDGSTVTLVGCAIQGGEGGLASGAICEVVHATGGPGVEFVGAPSVVRSAESTAVGGAVNLEPLCPGQTGPQGPAISGSGTIVALPGFARHLRANSPVRGGAALTFELGGVAGEIPAIFVNFYTQAVFLDPVPQVWLGAGTTVTLLEASL